MKVRAYLKTIYIHDDRQVVDMSDEWYDARKLPRGALAESRRVQLRGDATFDLIIDDAMAEFITNTWGKGTPKIVNLTVEDVE